jgi:hypothetical protein
MRDRLPLTSGASYNFSGRVFRNVTVRGYKMASSVLSQGKGVGDCVLRPDGHQRRRPGSGVLMPHEQHLFAIIFHRHQRPIHIVARCRFPQFRSDCPQNGELATQIGPCPMPANWAIFLLTTPPPASAAVRSRSRRRGYHGTPPSTLIPCQAPPASPPPWSDSTVHDSSGPSCGCE